MCMSPWTLPLGIQLLCCENPKPCGELMWKRIMALQSEAPPPPEIQDKSQHQLQPFEWIVLEILAQQSLQMTTEPANI